MTLRDNLDEFKAWAHAVLDGVRAGIPCPDLHIAMALRILVEPVDA